MKLNQLKCISAVRPLLLFNTDQLLRCVELHRKCISDTLCIIWHFIIEFYFIIVKFKKYYKHFQAFLIDPWTFSKTIPIRINCSTTFCTSHWYNKIFSTLFQLKSKVKEQTKPTTNRRKKSIRIPCKVSHQQPPERSKFPRFFFATKKM